MAAAVRARSRDTPDAKLRPEFYQVQKDVLFLYHLHKEVNMRALSNEEAFQLKVSLLSENLDALIHGICRVSVTRVDAFEFPDDLSKPLPERSKTADELTLDEQITDWAAEEEVLWAG